MNFIIIIIIALALTEIIARKLFFKQHGIPYRVKRVGDYRYDQFIEACGPPLHWKLKPAYGDTNMHINRLGLRSPELQSGRKRIWVVGESDLFGAKLACEKDIWFLGLQHLLDRAQFDYQVVNASIIGYNIRQTAETVLSLPIGEGDILLVRPNQNDLSIAYMHGAQWTPGLPWPMDFIHQLRRRMPWYFKVLDVSCVGMRVRQKLSKTKTLADAMSNRSGFQWPELMDYQEDMLRRMIDYAQGRGAAVGMFDTAMSYQREVSSRDAAGLSALQSNWRAFVDGWGEYQFMLIEEAVQRVAAPLGLPMLRIAPHIWKHPRRFELYLDLVHFNAQGHQVYSKALFAELQASGLLQGGGA